METELVRARDIDSVRGRQLACEEACVAQLSQELRNERFALERSLSDVAGGRFQSRHANLGGSPFRGN
eukprot:3007578-Amphidinium_carterae.1